MDMICFVSFRFVNDEFFDFFQLTFRIKSLFIPTKIHLAKRHALQSRRVCIFILHDLLNKHGRSVFKKRKIIKLNENVCQYKLQDKKHCDERIFYMIGKTTRHNG